jgi:hypothetical protein
MKPTLREQIIAKMIEDGHTEIASTSRKYRRLTSHHPEKFFWVGKMGGVRLGRTVSSSLSMGDYWFKRVRPGAI